MDSTINYFHILIISLLWIGYFLIHSITASLGLKHWVANHYSHLMPAYRLTFNMVSTVLIIPVLWLSFKWSSEPLWHWSPVLFWVTSLISVLTIIAFYFSLNDYDMSEFMGTRQWFESTSKVEDQEQFVIGQFHRFVRHPWYSMGIILIWCRELDPIMLTNAIWITMYFVIGSRLEERKLVQYHGEIYRLYCHKVPALIPRPWRYLTQAQAKQLLSTPLSR